MGWAIISITRTGMEIKTEMEEGKWAFHSRHMVLIYLVDLPVIGWHTVGLTYVCIGVDLECIAAHTYYELELGVGQSTGTKLIVPNHCRAKICNQTSQLLQPPFPAYSNHHSAIFLIISLIDSNKRVNLNNKTSLLQNLLPVKSPSSSPPNNPPHLVPATL